MPGVSMGFDPHATIVALASAPGPGFRGIVRLSGQATHSVLEQLRFSDLPLTTRGNHSGHISLPGFYSPLPVDVFFFPGPGSYTGEDVAEVHSIGSPPLLNLVLEACLKAGARAAHPGEFTQRAFRAGKLDLTRAEAVLAVIEAESRDELKVALTQLAGGMAKPLQRLREDLLDLLADVEAALDFADEEVPSLPQEQLLHRLAAALAHLTLVKKQIEQRGLADRPFRVALAGPPNAGKSSLFNALLGKSAALVSPVPGTTRDYLEGTLMADGVRLILVDTAGLGTEGNAIETQAQKQGREQHHTADLVVWCREVWRAGGDDLARDLPPALEGIVVWTKVDLAPAPGEGLATSVTTGYGLEALIKELVQQARARPRSGLAPSLSRCRHHVEACLACLRRAHAVVLEEDPPEILALEIRSALEELGAIVGTVFTEDLLDRIFSRFCIGK